MWNPQTRAVTLQFLTDEIEELERFNSVRFIRAMRLPPHSRVFVLSALQAMGLDSWDGRAPKWDIERVQYLHST